MAPRVTLDLSALNSGLVVIDRQQGRTPSGLSITTRPEARAYKSNVTRRAFYSNRPLNHSMNNSL